MEVADTFTGVTARVGRNAQCLMCVRFSLGLTQSLVSKSDVSKPRYSPLICGEILTTVPVKIVLI